MKTADWKTVIAAISGALLAAVPVLSAGGAWWVALLAALGAASGAAVGTQSVRQRARERSERRAETPAAEPVDTTPSALEHQERQGDHDNQVNQADRPTRPERPVTEHRPPRPRAYDWRTFGGRNRREP